MAQSVNTLGIKRSIQTIFSGLFLFFRRYKGILLGFVGLSVLLTILSPAFLTSSNIMNVLRQVSTNANLALGMTFAILICGIDLSVGSVLALGGTVAAGLITRSGLPVGFAVLIGVLVGGGLGCFNGVVIAKTKIPPFIVTLAMMQIARGAAYVYTNGMPIRTIDKGFVQLGTGYLGPIPLPVVYTIIFFLILLYVLNNTRFGRHVYALGGNEDAALYAGIKSDRIVIAVYTLTGLLSAFSGVILCARMYSGQPTIGVSFELDAIAAVVLGGTSMAGGIGHLGGTMIGALVMGVLNNGLNLLGINSFWQLIVKGFVILMAVYFDVIKKKRV